MDREVRLEERAVVDAVEVVRADVDIAAADRERDDRDERPRDELDVRHPGAGRLGGEAVIKPLEGGERVLLLPVPSAAERDLRPGAVVEQRRRLREQDVTSTSERPSEKSSRAER